VYARKRNGSIQTELISRKIQPKRRLRPIFIEQRIGECSLIVTKHTALKPEPVSGDTGPGCTMMVIAGVLPGYS
jgi:hypothetical protein